MDTARSQNLKPPRPPVGSGAEAGPPPFAFPFSTLTGGHLELPASQWPVVGIGGSAESLDSLIAFVVASIAKRDASSPETPSRHSYAPAASRQSVSSAATPAAKPAASRAAAGDRGPDGTAAYVVVARGLTAADADTLVEEIRHSTGAPVSALQTQAQADPIEPGRIYVASADLDRYPSVEDGRLRIALAPARRENPFDRATIDCTVDHDILDRGTTDDHRPVVDDALDHDPDRPSDQGPLDHFFETLANEYGERAIAVILAGAGEDGAAGVRAIRDLGGRALVQDPDSASPREMPGSAIAAGLVEDALPLDALAVRVREYADSVGHCPGDGGSRAPRQSSIAIATAGRDEQRQTAAAGPSAARGEPPQLLRDPQAWTALRERVIKPLLRSRPSTTPFRAWVASESGEDAYSLGMMVAEAARELEMCPPVRILVSLTHGDALVSARRGVFSHASIERLPADLRHYFVDEGFGYVATNALRENFVFAHHDLFHDTPFSYLDAIVCRDHLSTVTGAARAHLLEIFRRSLNPEGALFVGAHDTIVAPGSRGFAALDRRHSIFRVAIEPKLQPSPRRVLASPGPTTRDAESTLEVDTPGRRPEAHRSSPALILGHGLPDPFAPATVLIDEDLRVLYVHGHVEAYLSAAVEGERTADLLAMLSPRLAGPVRTAALRALDDRRATLAAAELGDGGEMVLITMVPIEPLGRGRLLSVTFTPCVSSVPAAALESGSIRPQPGSRLLDPGADRPQEWTTVLRAWGGVAADNQRLRSVIGHLQASSEELIASREELQTMYTEVEQVNARLLLVNAELQAQLVQLKALSDDVVHLLDGTELASVFLDSDGRVRRFTPRIRELVRLLPADVGRPFSDFARDFEDPALDADVARALKSSLSAEGVARGTKADRWFLRRVIPCWTARGDVDGAVLTFTDISTHQRTEESLRKSNVELEELVRQRTAVAVLQQDIAVIANENASMEQAFAATLERLCREAPWVAGHVYVVRGGMAEDSVWHEDARSGGRLERRLGGMTIGPGDGLVSQVIEDGQARSITDLESDQRFRQERGRPFRVRSIAVFPILAGERVVGAFEFFSRAADPPSATLLEVMRNVGTQIGRVIEREESREHVFELAVEEQRSLGEELHDTLSQQVHGLTMLAQSMIKGPAAQGVNQVRMRALIDGLVEAHKQIRVLSNGLVPVRVEAGGLAGALEEMARGWQQMHGAACVFEREGESELEDDRVATALYRIAREAARNAVLHGEAKRVVIRLIDDEDGVTLEVRDDGRGMARVPADGPGMGLQIMRHRCEQLGGKLEIESSPGQGTIVRCRIVKTRELGVERRS